MRGRMPFPDPILPIAIIAMVFALIAPLCMENEESTESERSVDDSVEQELVSDYDDPFSENYDPQRVDDEAKPIKIITKYIEVTSGTEELKFDWIREPFEDDFLDVEEKK